MMKRLTFFSILSLSLLSACQTAPIKEVESSEHSEHSEQLYWFIPDGLRADPEEFNIFRWAQEGKLPNLKRMMEEGSYGYSIPDFPSHTPTNFASLLTGAHPNHHGISDGPMHAEGNPLEFPSVGGFSSQAKRVAPVWTYLERDLNKKVVLLSIPGSTPPELTHGITIRGRWGGWGADTPSVIFESKGLLKKRRVHGKGFRIFYFGAPLTIFTERKPNGEAELAAQGMKLFAQIPRGKAGKVRFGFRRGETVAELMQGQWSEWLPTKVLFKGIEVPTQIRLQVIKLWPNGDFRIRMLFNQLNHMIVQPGFIADDLNRELGPMVDYADNWPHQLVYELEDKKTFLDEARFSWDWHRRASAYILDKYAPDAMIQDIYTPNLMLESRWWYANIDKTRKDYNQKKADAAWKDILEMYQGIDAILGEALARRKPDSTIVFSSDHGVCHLDRLVRLNNYFAQRGWLKFKIDPVTGESSVDWKNTKVIYLKMAHIFISPTGLGGKWHRAKGPAYEKLRNEVIEGLRELEDTNGKKPFVNIVKWEQAESFYHLPMDRIGDLVVEATPGYFWYEELTEDRSIFINPITTGYKQTIDARKNSCMWTPFAIIGPKIKKGHALQKPISHVDQLPTVLRAMGWPEKSHMDGKPIEEVLIP